MVFDSTGTLLLTACSQGLFCNLFRIAPHPTNSKQASVLHLYILKRGDTPCTVKINQNVDCFTYLYYR